MMKSKETGREFKVAVYLVECSNCGSRITVNVPDSMESELRTAIKNGWREYGAPLFYKDVRVTSLCCGETVLYIDRWLNVTYPAGVNYMKEVVQV